MQGQIKELLLRDLPAIPITLQEEQVDQLVTHLVLLVKWNRKLNLTAITTPKEMVINHVLDSLVVSPYLCGESYLDVGTGGGFPGLPLSIAFPEHKWILLDSRFKRIAFINYVIRHLRLSNVKTLAERIENQPVQKFDTVIARAFSSLSDLITLCNPLLTKGSRLIAMKGRYPDQELEQIESLGLKQLRVEKMVVPQQKADRHIVVIDF